MEWESSAAKSDVFAIPGLVFHYHVSPVDRTLAGAVLLGDFASVVAVGQRNTASRTEDAEVLEVSSVHRLRGPVEFWEEVVEAFVVSEPSVRIPWDPEHPLGGNLKAFVEEGGPSRNHMQKAEGKEERQ